MQLLLALSTLATIVTGVYVGVRLLRLAQRTRQLPELAAGAGLFCFAALAYPFMITMLLGHRTLGAGAVDVLLVACLVAYWTTLVTLGVFTQHTYHPGVIWARGLVGGIALLGLAGGALLVTHFDVSVFEGSPPPPLLRLGNALVTLCYVAVFGWTGVESLRYHGRMRRRLRLGLAEPDVVDRFLVWGLGTATAALLTLTVVCLIAAGITVANSPLPPILQASTGLVSSVTWYLTFAPPERYLRWVRARHADA
jgi:hypothetical protein